MDCLAKPTHRTGKSEAPARASVPERFRRLKRNEVVWSGDFVADERLGFELWEAPDVFRAGSFARPIYQKEETERFRPTSTRKPKQKITAYLNQTAAGARASAPFLENHNLPYEDRDIINNPFNYAEILEKSGQSLSSCVEVNGHMPGRCQRGRSGSLPARSRRAAFYSPFCCSSSRLCSHPVRRESARCFVIEIDGIAVCRYCQHCCNIE